MVIAGSRKSVNRGSFRNKTRDSRRLQNPFPSFLPLACSSAGTTIVFPPFPGKNRAAQKRPRWNVLLFLECTGRLSRTKPARCAQGRVSRCADWVCRRTERGFRCFGPQPSLRPSRRGKRFRSMSFGDQGYRRRGSTIGLRTPASIASTLGRNSDPRQRTRNGPCCARARRQ